MEDSLHEFRILIELKLASFIGDPEPLDRMETRSFISLFYGDLGAQHEGGWLVGNTVEMWKSGCQNQFAVSRDTILGYSSTKLQVETPGGVRLTGCLSRAGHSHLREFSGGVSLTRVFCPTSISHWSPCFVKMNVRTAICF